MNAIGIAPQTRSYYVIYGSESCVPVTPFVSYRTLNNWLYESAEVLR